MSDNLGESTATEFCWREHVQEGSLANKGQYYEFQSSHAYIVSITNIGQDIPLCKKINNFFR